MAYQTISVAEEGTVAVVMLNRPDALNALNLTMASELQDVLSLLAKKDTVRCVILTGSDRAFCAGADIKEMSGLTTPDLIRDEHFRALWDAVADFPRPIIAALSGYTLGGGLELAMCCDILIASQGTKLGQPEINIGIIPGGGGTQRLTRIVGKYRSMEMILTGAQITAEQAEAYGLVNKVVPPGQQLEEAKKIASSIASKSPSAVKLAKMAIRRAQETGLSDGLEYERQLFYMLFATKDKEEGMKAFLEKRKPDFKGE